MSRIITKNRDPRVNEFGPNDLVLNTTTGDLFLKSNNKLFKIAARDLKQNKSNEEVLNNITVVDINTLKEGKTINTITKNLGEGDDGKANIIRPDAIMSPIDDITYSKYTTTGRIGTFISGTLFHDLNLNGSNNNITMGNGTTNLTLSGSINEATLDGGSF